MGGGFSKAGTLFEEVAGLPMKKEDLIICRCEEITDTQICEAIRLGMTTPNEIKRFTRAGMGLCQGKTCRHLVAGILSRETGQPLSELIPSRYRPPLRPVALSTLATLIKEAPKGEKDDED